jgi:hypothetical protein
MIPFPPIHYNRGHVALIVKYALFLCEDLAKKIGEAADRLALIAAGTIDPTPAVLNYFELHQEGDGYVWYPR